jgi:peptidoglycan L-alanyl-D-glutamate endopeptidase CwlK
MMDARSEQTLAGVFPGLALLVRQAQAALTPQNIFMCVYSGLRTQAQQNADYAKGRTTEGPIVTNAKAGWSNHNYGLAVDIVPYLQGAEGALNWTVESAQFQAMVKALKATGLVYGGDWPHFQDNDHFQMPNMPPSPDAAMLRDYTSEAPLAMIWENYVAGRYAQG